MTSNFPKTSDETRKLAEEVVRHLRYKSRNTNDRNGWTLQNFQALCSFEWSGGKLERFPPNPSSRKGAFLWDFIAYAPGEGILIAAESEWDRGIKGLQHDFEKLLYVRSPVKVLIFWTDKQDGASESIVKGLEGYMRSCVDQYSPSEVFVLYCRTWEDEESKNDDRVWMLQIAGPPSHVRLGESRFERFI